MYILSSFDKALLFLINRDLAHPLLDPLMLFISNQKVWLALGCLVLMNFTIRRRWRQLRICILMILAIAVGDLIAYKLLKPGFGRIRPCYQLAEEVRLVQNRCGSDFGFPSNHATNGMAAFLALALCVRRRWLIGIFGVILATGYSRVYLGVHFPGDVLAGFFLGAVVGCLIYLVAHRLGVPEAERPLGFPRGLFAKKPAS